MKKNYNTPKLKVYGGVETLTKGFDDMGGDPYQWGNWWHRLWDWLNSQSQGNGGCGDGSTNGGTNDKMGSLR